VSHHPRPWPTPGKGADVADGTARPCQECGRPKKWRGRLCDVCRSWYRYHPGEGPRPTGRFCGHCGAGIDHLKTHARYCSEACGEVARGERRAERIAIKPCRVCGTSFRPRQDAQDVCGQRCGWTLASRKRRARLVTGVRAQESRSYRARRPQHVVIRQRELKRVTQARRNARKAGVLTIPFTADQLAQRLSMFPGCWMCGGQPESVDHVKPVAAGGAHVLANLRPACGSCNSAKRDRWPLAV
jgi:5-methylcytosine-specific restriction endonuclease McrA